MGEFVEDAKKSFEKMESPNFVGLYYIREKIANVPVTQLIMSKNRLTACIGFYNFLDDDIKSKHLNPKNYELHLVGMCNIDSYKITSFEDEVVSTGDTVRNFLIESGVFTSEVEDVMPSKEVEVIEHE